MGNCWGTPAEIHSLSTSTKPPSSGQSANNSNENIQVSATVGLEKGSVVEGHILPSPKLRIYSFAELKSATRNFKPDSVLGEGGFGTVFKGWVDEKTHAPTKIGLGLMVAVKKLNPESLQGTEEWQAEVNFLGRLSHPNLVKLWGFCCEDREFLLVYEFMPRGSLENHLFRRGSEPLSWAIRLKIAIGAARGLAFLHTSEKKVIYRDFKASNILLDGHFNAKLSDFGMAKNGPIAGNSHVTTRIMGTYGYAAPEYVATGHLYVKSDVYGFGVVLLEMLTGLRAIDPHRPSGQHNLVDWLKPSLSDRRKLKQILDSKLNGEYPIKAAVKAAQLTLKCLGPDPRQRPSMKEVVEALEEIEAIKEKHGKTSGAVSTGHHLHGRSHTAHPRRSPLHQQTGARSPNYRPN